MQARSLKWFQNLAEEIQKFPTEIIHSFCRAVTVLQGHDDHQLVSRIQYSTDDSSLDVFSQTLDKIQYNIYLRLEDSSIRVLHSVAQPIADQAKQEKNEIEIAAGRVLPDDDHTLFRTSSSNSFEVLKIDLPDEYRGEAIICNDIYKVLQKRNLDRSAAQKIMDCKTEFVTAIFDGTFSGFAIRWPAVYLSRLGFDMEIDFKPTSDKLAGHIIINSP